HGKTTADAIGSGTHDAGPGRLAADTRAEQETPDRAGIERFAPRVAQRAAALRDGALEMPVPHIHERGRQPPLHEVPCAGQLAEEPCGPVRHALSPRTGSWTRRCSGTGS